MKIETLNIRNLTQAISEHIGENKISYIDENCFLLNGHTLKFDDNLARIDVVSIRYHDLKNFLFALKDERILNIGDDTIIHILNRYRHLNSVSI